MAGVIPERGKASNAQLLKRVRISKGDITKQCDVDAVVTAISANLMLDGSLNQSLLAAAGAELDAFILENIYKPKPGDAYLMPGFNLPVKNIIIVVTPYMRDSFDMEDVHLLRCYRHAMELAQKSGLVKIAFPALCTGKNGYPPARAARLALRGVMERISAQFTEVRIVCNTDKTLAAFQSRLQKYGKLQG